MADTPQDESFYRGMALAAQTLTATFVVALANRGVLDRAAVRELVDEALLTAEEFREKMPKDVCDSARAQIDLLLNLIDASRSG